MRLPRRIAQSLSAVALLVSVPSLAVAQPVGADAFTEALSRGPLYAALAALVGGLLVSLTPCVYPMIAVTVSVFGARESRSHWHSAGLSGAFVLGIITTFVPLGVVAGVTGSMFGSVLQNRWVVAAIAGLFLAMAMSMFGAFELALPSSWTNRLAQVGGFGYRGAFGVGMVCGLIAAPCTGPVLTGILTWIARTKSAGLGALAMSAFSLGLGAPFFLVGAFAVHLPKSGRWMVHVKSVLGILLVVVALYILESAFPVLVAWMPRTRAFSGLAALITVLGLALGGVHRDFSASGAGAKLAKLAGVTSTSLGVFALVTAAARPAQSFDWEKTTVEQAQARALRERKPLLIDFTANWCAACKELEKLTFSDPGVLAESTRFVTVRLDATHDDNPKVEATLEKFRVVGLPTLLVFDSSGKQALRYTDFVDAAHFLQALKKVN
jgi:thiol:disulfide interchange protein DsbD